MTDPPPRLWWAGRVWRTLLTAARPWVIGLAAVGAGGVTFPLPFRFDGTGGALPAGPGFGVTAVPTGLGGDRRILWASLVRRPVEFPTAEWWETGGGYGWAAIDTWFAAPRGGAGPFAAARPARPPEMSAVGATAWAVLGVPAVWSAAALIFASRRDEPAARPSRAYRLVRPWTVTFAVVGAAILANHLTVPDRTGPRGFAVETWVERWATVPHPRDVRVRCGRWRLPVSAGTREASRSARIGLLWLLVPPVAANGATVSLDRRRRSRIAAG